MIKATIRSRGQAAGKVIIELMPEDKEDEESIRRFVREKGLCEDQPELMQISVNLPSHFGNKKFKLVLTF